ncbi:hypothetical protein MMAD_19970 [Mycolicibacterium madagascariense]|uniref:GAF domain-containing protein n=1 Tax=Mycolicibacterium madagascariense TaxID=212765 RepID=A0A7I7XET4_9MYCO|nr:hypothetical protein MMAD_19970 [Mycolicibacterium madagascariense]
MQALEEEAAAVGETVDTFIGRAVAARLIAAHESRDGGRTEELLGGVERAGLAAAGPLEDPCTSRLEDPERLRALYSTGLLDADPDAAYDRLVGVAAEALAVPTAAVSLVDHDRQFLFSAVGLTGELAETRQTPIDQSVCQYVVNSGEPLIVEDARAHPLLKDHPTVLSEALLAYAGMPLTDPSGHTIGTLCVWDKQPRQWSTGHVQILHDLSTLVRERVFDGADVAD